MSAQLESIPANPFLEYKALGYDRLVPVIPPNAEIAPNSVLAKRVGTKQDGRGKTPGVKNHAGLWHSFDWLRYEADEHDLVRWAVMGAGVGIRTGNGLIAIDADTTDTQLASQIRDVVARHLGRVPVRVGRYPKALYLCRVDGPCPYQRVEFRAPGHQGAPERVEILAEGRFFVAEGIHPKTGKPYTWPRGKAPIDALPIVPPATITAILDELRTLLPNTSEIVREGATTNVPQEALTAPLEAVKRAVEAIPNTDALFPSREHYRDMGYAIKASLPDHPDEAFDIFMQWCARWDGGVNDPEVVAADWKRMKPPYRRGASWLFELAEQHGKGNFSTAEVWFDQIDQTEADRLARTSDLQRTSATIQAEAARQQQVQAQARARFRFEPFAEIAFDPAQSNKPLIKGLLESGTLSVLYGDSNVGKTFVAMDMAFHIATGTPYAGMKVNQGLVVYVAAEGGNGARKRVMALKDRYPEQADRAQFLLLPSSVDLRTSGQGSDVEAFEAALKGIAAEHGTPAMIVIDTLSRALAGGDENSPVDMGALVKNLDRVRAVLPGTHVMVIHHTGKDRAKGARGHTLLRAAVDTEIEVSEGQIMVTKQRDLDKSWSSTFGLRVHVLGVDEDGDPITSCTVRMGAVSAVKGGVTGGEAAVLSGLTELANLSETPEAGVPVKELVDFLANGPDKMTENSTRQILKRLAARRMVKSAGRGRWVVDKTRIPAPDDDQEVDQEADQEADSDSNTDVSQ